MKTLLEKNVDLNYYKFDLFKFVLLYNDGYNAVIHIIFLLSFISMWNYTDKNLYCLVNICNFFFWMKNIKTKIYTCCIVNATATEYISWDTKNSNIVYSFIKLPSQSCLALSEMFTTFHQTYPNFDKVCIKKAVGLVKLKRKCQAVWSVCVQTPKVTEYCILCGKLKLNKYLWTCKDFIKWNLLLKYV